MNSSAQIQQADRALEDKPEWLDVFLQRTFFDRCQRHNLSKNKSRKYCIDCDSSLCHYCMKSCLRSTHRILKIYKYVNKDTVLVTEIQNHIDCSEIQAYKRKGKLMIAIDPLPPYSSDSNFDKNASCSTCTRRLTDPIVNSYCSIACKVKAFEGNTNKSEIKKEGERKRKRKRKGNPHRSPPYC